MSSATQYADATCQPNVNTRRNPLGIRLRHETITLACILALGTYVELRDLRYFEALASELNFGRAANALHLTQPALSLAVARLERQVGCALFQRTHQGVSLTAAGSVLLAETRGLHYTLERARTLARRASEGDLGSLTIGFLDAAVFDVLPSALTAFQASHPGVDLTLRQRSSSELIALVERGALDVAFVRPDIPRADIEMRVVLREDTMVVISRDHPLADTPRLRLAQLAEERFIFVEREFAPSIYARWMELCAAALFTPQIAAYVGSAQVLVELAAQNVGIGFATRSWVQGHDRAVALPLSDVQMDMAMALAYRPDRMSTACENFVDLVLALFEQDGRPASSTGLPAAFRARSRQRHG
jgi:DNA-binding transcriptional LysR family regulator